jgi:hypothetical protein
MSERPAPNAMLAYPALVLGAVTLILHAFANQHYGYFRDELYFIVCGRHPAWGYVDQPPLVPLIAGFADWVAPGSLTVLRAMPALTEALLIAATVGLTRYLGGQTFAQWLAGLCLLLAPIHLIFGVLLFTDLFLPLAWLGCAFFLIRMLRTGDARGWVPFGFIVGLALWSKYMILFDVAALAVALPFSPLRRTLATPWPYLGAAVALAIIAPNIAWQWRHGWPFLELGAAAATGRGLTLSPLAYLMSQITLQNPGAAVVWIAGLAAVAVAPKWRLYRLFAVQWIVLIAIEIALHGKDYYASSLYPPLFAIGATAIETAVRTAVARGALAAAVLAIGLLVAPLALPILPVDRLVAYEHVLGYKPAPSEERGSAELPQYFGDMFGWREMAKAVSDAYWALPAEERAKAVFKGRNYGEAAAVDVFGDRLPPAISGHNNYYLWGFGDYDGTVLIATADDLTEANQVCTSVERVHTIESQHAMPDETGLSLIICRGLKIPLIELWPRFKNYS